MLRLKTFKPSMMALSVALSLVAPWVHAGTFEGVIQGDSNTLASSAADAYIYGSQNTAARGSSSYEGYVGNGTSRVSAMSDGTVATRVETSLTFRQSVTNPFASVQAVSFDFHIPRSRTTIDLGYGTNFQTFSAAASFIGTISWGGVTMWSVEYGVTGMGSVAQGGGSIQALGPLRSASASEFTVGTLIGNTVYLNTETSTTCIADNDGIEVCTDTQLTGLAGSGYLESDNYQGTLNLGTMAGNEQKELVYTLTARTSFEATYRDNSASDAYGYGGYAQAGGYDPFGINFTPNDDGTALKLAFATPTAPVPEPQTYALMLGGLALLAARLRQRREPPAQSAGTRRGESFNGAASG